MDLLCVFSVLCLLCLCARLLPDLSYTFSQYLIKCFFTAVRHEVNNLESSVVVQELELAINLAL